MAATRIWIVGHSIVHWAGVRAEESGLGAGLGFPPHVQVSWMARRGMRWCELLPLIQHRLKGEARPDAIVVHLGENDLPTLDCLTLRSTIQRDLGVLRSLVPDCKLFWSHWLQRQVWRGSFCPQGTEKARKRVNAVASAKVLELGGSLLGTPGFMLGQVSSIGLMESTFLPGGAISGWRILRRD